MEVIIFLDKIGREIQKRVGWYFTIAKKLKLKRELLNSWLNQLDLIYYLVRVY